MDTSMSLEDLLGRIKMKTNRNILELKEIIDTPESLEDFKELYNQNISELNFVLSRLLLESNLDADIKTVTIPSSTTARVNHSLKVKPKYRIILKQVGGGVITDLNYTANYIELKNNGTTECELTVAIVRG